MLSDLKFLITSTGGNLAVNKGFLVTPDGGRGQLNPESKIGIINHLK